MNNCLYCSFQSSSKLCAVKHLFEAHNFESNFRYACELIPCTRVFVMGDSFNAFRSHCTRYHLNWKERLSSLLNESEVSADDDDLMMDTLEMGTHGSASESATDTRQCEELEETSNIIIEGDNRNEVSIGGRYPGSHFDVEQTAAHFILNLKERFKLTQASLNFAIKAVDELIMISANNIKESVTNEVGDAATIIPDHCFLPDSPFLNLRSEYQQTKFFKEKFNLVVSICKYLISITFCMVLSVYSNLKLLYWVRHLNISKVDQYDG